MTSKKTAEKNQENDDAEDFYVEEVIDRPFSRKLAGRLMHYLRPYKGLVLLSVMLILTNTALSLIGPLLIKEAVDGPLALPTEETESRELTGIGQLITDLGEGAGLSPIVVGSSIDERTQWLWVLVGIYAFTLLIQILMRYGETMVLNRTG